MTDRLIEEARAGRPLSCFVLDSHCHLGDTFFHVIDPTVTGLLGAMDRCGVKVSVASSTAGCVIGHIREGNDEVIAAVRAHPDRIIGLTTVDPHRPQRTAEELARAHDAGMRGIKVHHHVGLEYDHPNYECVWQFARERRCPVLAHTWGRDTLQRLTPLFKKYPEVTWMLGHSGAADREMYVQIAREYSNVFLELCFSVCPRGLVEYFVGEGLADRLLFGSDAVFMDTAPQIGRVIFAQIPVQDKLKILGENARRIWYG